MGTSRGNVFPVTLEPEVRCVTMQDAPVEAWNSAYRTSLSGRLSDWFGRTQKPTGPTG
ncbi:hypothetical protein GCM10007979_19390 [Nocardioides albus]|nr:hypothetical protein GCM10007979_19390 [Nocardioides albus]